MLSSPHAAGGSSELTLKPMSPFLQQRQASMRKTKVKRPEKETATTAKDEGHDSSLRGAPSATSKHKASVKRVEAYRSETATCRVQEIKDNIEIKVICTQEDH